VSEPTVAPVAAPADAVAWFSDLTRADVPRVGGKGANLGELVHAGLPVPPGFVVTADAYLSAMQRGGVREALASLSCSAMSRNRSAVSTPARSGISARLSPAARYWRRS